MIRAENIRKKYKKNVLNDITFAAEKGGCTIIVGENGCGKSTLLSILSGALKADSGDIFFGEENASKNRRLFRKYVGYVPQENPLINELTVYDNLSLWYGKDKKALKKTLSDGFAQTLGLSDVLRMPVGKLSGGMKKRVSIASAMANEPPVMILDEPGNALDIICKEDIKRYLKIYMEQGGTVVMTTHDADELSLCTKLLVMRGGVLEEISAQTRGAELFEAIKGHGNQFLKTVDSVHTCKPL